MQEGLKCLPKEAHEALVRVVQVYLQRRLQALEPGPLITLYWEEFYRLYSLRRPATSDLSCSVLAQPEQVRRIMATVFQKCRKGTPPRVYPATQSPSIPCTTAAITFLRFDGHVSSGASSGGQPRQP
jgi:hypothetical protein